MDKKQIRKQFLPLAEGRLSEAESRAYHSAINDSPELRREFAEFQRMHTILTAVRNEPADLHSSLCVAIMEKIGREQGAGRSVVYDPILPLGVIVAGLAILSVVEQPQRLIGMAVIFISSVIAAWGALMIALSLKRPSPAHLQPKSRGFLICTFPLLVALVGLAGAGLYFQAYSLITPMMTTGRVVLARYDELGIPTVIRWALLTGIVGLVFGIIQQVVAILLVRCWWQSWCLSRPHSERQAM